MTPFLELLLEYACAVTPAPGAPRIVGIDGPSGAGKTTFADSLTEALWERTGFRPQVVHMDDVYAGWTGLSEAVNLVADLVLTPLSEGREGAFRRWDWSTSARAETIRIPIADWLILEGVGAGSRRCRPHLAAVVWLEADRSVRMARGLERDGEAFLPHWEPWAAQEENLFAAEDTRRHATLILQT